MPMIYVVILSVLVTYLLCITTFLLVYVILTGKQQNRVNTQISLLLTQHNEQINYIEQRLPITVNKQGVLE